KLILEGRFVYGFGAIYTHTTGLISKDRTTISAPLPFTSTRDVVPILSIAGWNTLTGFSNYIDPSSKRTIGGSATWIHGNHIMKFGASTSSYMKKENALAGNNQGQFSAFNNTPAILPAGQSAGSVVVPNIVSPLSTNTIAALQAWANFLLGNSASFTQNKLDVTADFRQRTIEGYAQDEWRIRSNVTLYLGVRYSYFGGPYDKLGQLTNFDV